MRSLADHPRRVVAIVATLLLGVATVSTVLALSATDFEYRDGDTAATSPHEDWNDLTTGMGGASAVTAGRYGAVIDDNNYLSERTLFTGGGSKDTNDVSQWAWRAVGQPPDKTDLLNAAAALYEDQGDGTHDYLYFMADRYATNGDAKVGFWFFQQPVVVRPDPTSNTFGVFGDGTPDGLATHTPGDILVEASFTNGGRVPAINVYTWTASGLRREGDVDGFDCRDSAALSSYEVCGTVNNVDNGLYRPGWTYSGKFGDSRQAGAFFEGALDLHALFPAGTPCFSSFLAETRAAASSVTSELKDFVLGSFDTCGSITIRKDRLGGSSSDSWDFSSATLGDFTLHGSANGTYVEGQTKKTFGQQLPGTYVVTETTAGDGWVLDDIVCTGGGTTTDEANGRVTIELVAGADVICTFVNAQAPELKVTKIISPADDAGRFNLLVDGIVEKASASSGESTGWLDASVGTHAVSEDTADTGTEISAYTTTIACYDRADGDASVTATMTGDRAWDVTLGYGQRVECVITNTLIPVAFSRTQGYWQTHPDMVFNTWTGVYGTGDLLTDFGCVAPSSSESAGSDQVLGGFWANVAYTTGGDRRENISKAKMTLLQQLLAAILNVRYFGAANDSIVGQIGDAQDAVCSGTMGQINTSAGLMGAYNESGDYDGGIAENTHADPDLSRERADIGFWDSVN